jgi:hypothetical protein
LLFLFSGLPWAKSWGGYLKVARKISGTAVVHQDWTTGRSSEIADRLAMNCDGTMVRWRRCRSMADMGCT